MLRKAFVRQSHYAAFSFWDTCSLDENSPSSDSSVKELANAMIQQRNIRLSNPSVGTIVHPSFRDDTCRCCLSLILPHGQVKPRGHRLSRQGLALDPPRFTFHG